MVFIVPAFLSGLLRGLSGTLSSASLFIYLPWLMLLFVFPVFILALRWQSRRAFTVEADGGELVWRRGWSRRRVVVPLQQVRAFFKVTPSVPPVPVQPLGLGPRTTYAVVAPEGTLAWADPLDADDEEFEASERLARFIVARTGLPLRDLSALATELAQSAGNIKRALSEHIPTGDEGAGSRLSGQASSSWRCTAWVASCNITRTSTSRHSRSRWMRRRRSTTKV